MWKSRSRSPAHPLDKDECSPRGKEGKGRAGRRLLSWTSRSNFVALGHIPPPQCPHLPMQSPGDWRPLCLLELSPGNYEERHASTLQSKACLEFPGDTEEGTGFVREAGIFVGVKFWGAGGGVNLLSRLQALWRSTNPAPGSGDKRTTRGPRRPPSHRPAGRSMRWGPGPSRPRHRGARSRNPPISSRKGRLFLLNSMGSKSEGTAPQTSVSGISDSHPGEPDAWRLPSHTLSLYFK